MDDKNVDKLMEDLDKKLTDNPAMEASYIEFFKYHFSNEFNDQTEKLEEIFTKIEEVVAAKKGDICTVCGTGKILITGKDNEAKCNNPKCPTRNK